MIASHGEVVIDLIDQDDRVAHDHVDECDETKQSNEPA
jgi:hypothetical protein